MIATTTRKYYIILLYNTISRLIATATDLQSHRHHKQTSLMSSKSSKSKSKRKKTPSTHASEALLPSPLSTISTDLTERTTSEKTKIGCSEKGLRKRPSSESESAVELSQKRPAVVEDNDGLLKEKKETLQYNSLFLSKSLIFNALDISDPPYLKYSDNMDELIED